MELEWSFEVIVMFSVITLSFCLLFWVKLLFVLVFFSWVKGHCSHRVFS